MVLRVTSIDWSHRVRLLSDTSLQKQSEKADQTASRITRAVFLNVLPIIGNHCCPS